MTTPVPHEEGTPATGIISAIERLHDSLPRHFGTYAELRDALNKVAAARNSAVRRNLELIAELERVTRERDEARTELDRLRPVAEFLARAGTHPSAGKPDDPIEILERINHPSLVKRLDEERRPLEAEIAAMRPVVEAATKWRGRVAASILATFEIPLTNAVDAYRASGDTP